MRRVVWLGLLAIAGCGPRTDESNSHLGMEREVVVTATDADSVALKVGMRDVVRVRSGSKVWADDVLPFDTADRDVIVTVRASDIVASEGQAQDTTGSMPRKYLRAAAWQEPSPNRTRVRRLKVGISRTDLLGSQ